jgi:cytochrome c-type biogenesis protein CcmH/NrfG
MDTPGLLPEEGEPRGLRLRWVLGILALIFLLTVGLLAVQLTRLKRERDKTQARIDELLGELRRPPSAPRPESSSLARRVEELEARLGQVEASRRAEASAPPPAPGAREAPPAAVRPAETEAMIYVHVSVGFAGRGLTSEAVRSLGEALRLDPAASLRVKPRALFASPEEFERLQAELERRTRENPLDVEAKTVLAYLYYHEKGPDAAKVLLHQVLAADPDHAVARKLLETLER